MAKWAHWGVPCKAGGWEKGRERVSKGRIRGGETRGKGRGETNVDSSWREGKEKRGGQIHGRGAKESIDEIRLTVSSESPSVGFLKKRKEGRETKRSARRLSNATSLLHRPETPARPRTYGSLLHTDVLDDQVLNGDVLGLSVGLSVLEESEDESNRLLGPSSCFNPTDTRKKQTKNGNEDVSFVSTRRAIDLFDQRRVGSGRGGRERRLTLGGSELLSLASSSDTSGESSERNDLLVLLNVGEVGVSLGELHA